MFRQNNWDIWKNRHFTNWLNKCGGNIVSLLQLSIRSGGLSLSIIWNQGNTLKSRETRHGSHIQCWSVIMRVKKVAKPGAWKNNNRNCSGIMTQISIRYKSRTDAVTSNEKSMIGKHLSGTALYNMYLFCGSASVRLLFRWGLCVWVRNRTVQRGPFTVLLLLTCLLQVQAGCS